MRAFHPRTEESMSKGTENGCYDTRGVAEYEGDREIEQRCASQGDCLSRKLDSRRVEGCLTIAVIDVNPTGTCSGICVLRSSKG